MSTTSPATLAEIQFADNPEPRAPCVLLLDTSGSMAGPRIEALNAGLWTFKEDLLGNALALRRTEVAIVTFDSAVTVRHDFVTADNFTPPTLEATGATCMGGGILKALELLQARKTQYKANGIAYYRPWIFMITDGDPQGEPDSVVADAARQIAEHEANKRVAFFAVAVEGANLERLSQISTRAPLKLAGLKFSELFLWLSASMQGVAKSKIGDQVPLPPAGWSSV